MTLQVCVLASGSSGNSIFVSSGTTSILVDAGISKRAMGLRLDDIGVKPEQISAICLSHEHHDHMRGLPMLQKQFGWDVFANRGTIEGLQRNEKTRAVMYQVFSTGMQFLIGDLSIETFSVPHDAFEPVGFTVGLGNQRVGIVMDAGIPTSLIRERLRGCQMLIVESNYDEQLLMAAPRPWRLKQRIRGRQGHLSNETAAEMIAEVAHPGLSHVYLAHLSRECNREDLALRTARSLLGRLGHGHVQVLPTFSDRISEVWTG